MHLAVIAKQPRAGFVKTRLCPPCTPEQAAGIAAAALTDTLDAVDQAVAAARCRGLLVEPVLLFDGNPTGWLRPGHRFVAQRGDGLAQRLMNAFDDLGPGVVIGMEVPHAVHHLIDHFPAIDQGTDLLGLAVDGGYWAIGLHESDPRIFQDMPMSTTRTGVAQLSRLHALSRTVHLLPMVHDLDTVDDLRIAARRCGSRLSHAARAIVGPA